MTDGAPSQRNYEAVVFDMDGVLIAGKATAPEVYEDAADDAIEALGLDVPADRRGPLRETHYGDEMAARCQEIGVDPGEFWTTRERFASERGNRRIGTVREPFEDTAVLDALPVPLGVVSNNRAATVEYVAAELFPGRFEVAVGRDPTIEGFLERKPNPRYLNRALDGLGVERALYVGDRASDVETAHRAGIDGALVRREHNSDVTLAAESALEFDGLRGLGDLFDT